MSRREQTRARYPDSEGYVERDGVRVFYEVYGDGDPALLLLPTWEIVHSRVWKCQIPYLARHGRVVTFDRRGGGRSDRPSEVGSCDRRETALDALAVLDRAGVARATVVAWCGAGEELLLAVEHADRVAALVLIAPDLPRGAVVLHLDGCAPRQQSPRSIVGRLFAPPRETRGVRTAVPLGRDSCQWGMLSPIPGAP